MHRLEVYIVIDALFHILRSFLTHYSGQKNSPNGPKISLVTLVNQAFKEAIGLQQISFQPEYSRVCFAGNNSWVHHLLCSLILTGQIN